MSKTSSRAKPTSKLFSLPAHGDLWSTADDDCVTVSVTVQVGGAAGEDGGEPRQVGEGVVMVDDVATGKEEVESKQEPAHVEQIADQQEAVEEKEKQKEKQDERIDGNSEKIQDKELDYGKVKGEIQVVEEIPAKVDKKSE